LCTAISMPTTILFKSKQASLHACPVQLCRSTGYAKPYRSSPPSGTYILLQRRITGPRMRMFQLIPRVDSVDDQGGNTRRQPPSQEQDEKKKIRAGNVGEQGNLNTIFEMDPERDVTCRPIGLPGRVQFPSSPEIACAEFVAVVDSSVHPHPSSNRRRPGRSIHPLPLFSAASPEPSPLRASA